MSACEKCWNDAYVRSRMSGRLQAEIYRELLEERRDDPCPAPSPGDQAGAGE